MINYDSISSLNELIIPNMKATVKINILHLKPIASFSLFLKSQGPLGSSIYDNINDEYGSKNVSHVKIMKKRTKQRVGIAIAL
ncbi:hypothetical protein SAMN06265376_104445 [Dokdonia pacifica]|uniref:Uncharacterized protein n=1 Tax=Dokdonia pacifica TaxID=1627892 RepID=A0A239AJ81_9FLAO|nr:hypothetical protein SAMN06265376_104445 [Dokdonia pacifica]